MHVCLEQLRTHLFKGCPCCRWTLRLVMELWGLLWLDLPSPGCWRASHGPLPSLPPLLPPSCTDSLPLCSRVEGLPAGEFLPLPFQPSENWGLAGDQQPPCRKLLLWRMLWGVGPLPGPGTFATSLALLPGVEFNACIRTQWLPHEPRGTNAPIRFCQSLLDAYWWVFGWAHSLCAWVLKVLIWAELILTLDFCIWTTLLRSGNSTCPWKGGCCEYGLGRL